MNPSPDGERPAVCVFCGSSPGFDTVYADAARAFGAALVSRGRDLVYGGGSVGLMGVVADAVLDAGGRVTGVIPECLAVKELLHPRVEPMHIVPGMHERKALMASRASAFVALPGGMGTLEELFEVLTWAQLGIHRKPVGLLNTAGFFEPLLVMLGAMVATGFCRPEHLDLFVVADDPDGLLDRLATYSPPALPKWLNSDET